jgi:hypothetical protein
MAGFRLDHLGGDVRRSRLSDGKNCLLGDSFPSNPMKPGADISHPAQRAVQYFSRLDREQNPDWSKATICSAI